VAPGTFAAKADADAWLANERTAIGRGAWVDPDAGTIAFGDYAKDWLDQRHDLSPTSRELYRYLLKRHIDPTFGTVAIARITTVAIRSWHTKLVRQHATTAAKAYRLMAAILKTAAEDRHIAVSPCKVKGAAGEKAVERPVATVAEVQALAEAMPHDQRLAVLLAAWCQLRRGELLGLRRRDIDLLHGTITVAMTRVKTMAGTMVDKTPKTDAGRRTIAVPRNVVSEITSHLEDHVGSDPDSLVFDKGYRSLRTAWDNARRAVGVSYRLHDLRHAGLTWTAAQGATIAELMHRAGHASPIAALRYQHATEDRDRVLADALAELAPQAEVVPLDSQATR